MLLKIDYAFNDEASGKKVKLTNFMFCTQMLSERLQPCVSKLLRINDKNIRLASLKPPKCTTSDNNDFRNDFLLNFIRFQLFEWQSKEVFPAESLKESIRSSRFN